MKMTTMSRLGHPKNQKAKIMLMAPFPGWVQFYYCGSADWLTDIPIYRFVTTARPVALYVCGLRALNQDPLGMRGVPAIHVPCRRLGAALQESLPIFFIIFSWLKNNLGVFIRRPRGKEAAQQQNSNVDRLDDIGLRITDMEKKFMINDEDIQHIMDRLSKLEGHVGDPPAVVLAKRTRTT